MNKILQNYKIVEFVPKYDGFNEKEIKKIKQLETDRKEYTIYADFYGVSDKIVNAIRRTLIGELPIKALTCDIGSIDTNNEFILTDELVDRINFIPIHQDIDAKSEFKIYQINNTNKDMTIYSSHITGNENVKYIPKKFRLAVLKPAKELNIPKITVTVGYGYDNSMFSLTSDIGYCNIDYMDIHVINLKRNRVIRMVKTENVAKILKMVGVSGKIDDLYKKKILIIPSEKLGKSLNDYDKERLLQTKYDYKIIKDLELSDILPEESSLMINSKDIHLEVKTNGNIDPKKVIGLACTNLINRLESIKNEIDHPEKKLRISDKIVNGTLVKIFTIYGETHSIGELLLYYMYQNDINIPNIKKYMDSPMDNKIHIQVVHENPNILLKNAINSVIKKYKQIIKETLD